LRTFRFLEWDEDDRERVLDAAAFERHANAVAAQLKSRGLSPGDRVALLAGNCLDYLPSVMGILRAGCVAVPIAPKSTQAALASMLEDCEPSLVVCDRASLGRIPQEMESCDIATLAQAESSRTSAQASLPPSGGRDDDTALVLFTSGSTGRPKGVLLTHAGMLWALRTRLDTGSMRARDRALVAAPLAHMNGLVNTLLAYYAGAECLLLKRFEVRQYVRAIDRFAPTSLGAVPTMMAMLARECPREARGANRWPSVQKVMLGSAPCTEKLYDEVCSLFPSARVALGYGTTETGPLVFGPDASGGLPMPRMSVGKALPSVETRLEGGGDAGELFVRSPAMSRGYLKRPEATAERFRDGWYRTGDLMRRDANGFHFFCGRVDDMFTCGAENVYPGEVEAVIEQHPAVQQAVVVPAPDEVKGHVPVAFVVLRSGADATPAELKEFTLRGGLTYQHPRRVIVLAELPLAPTGKIDRKSLAAQAALSDASSPPPGTERRT
jgi:acyl-CoA synthetase (AMP-forming)/AMP-acid ligase II